MPERKHHDFFCKQVRYHSARLAKEQPLKQPINNEDLHAGEGTELDVSSRINMGRHRNGVEAAKRMKEDFDCLYRIPMEDRLQA